MNGCLWGGATLCLVICLCLWWFCESDINCWNLYQTDEHAVNTWFNASSFCDKALLVPFWCPGKQMCYLSTGTGSRVRHTCFRTVSFCRGRRMVSLTLLWLLKVAFCYLSPLLLSHHRHSLFTQSGYLSSTMHTVSYTHTHTHPHHP